MNIAKEIATLQRMTVGELLARYAEVFGEESRSRHREFLIRRIAWRVQAESEGGLSARALARAAEIANPADARVTPPRAQVRRIPAPQLDQAAKRPADPRLPRVGTAITRMYKGRTFHVVVRADGFEYAGEHFKTLTAVAKKITGQHLNGFRFFGLEGK